MLLLAAPVEAASSSPEIINRTIVLSAEQGIAVKPGLYSPREGATLSWLGTALYTNEISAGASSAGLCLEIVHDNRVNGFFTDFGLWRQEYALYTGNSEDAMKQYLPYPADLGGSSDISKFLVYLRSLLALYNIAITRNHACADLNFAPERSFQMYMMKRHAFSQITTSYVSFEGSNVMGRAYIHTKGALRTFPDLSVGVAFSDSFYEYTPWEMGITVAHELGHMLSLKHDSLPSEGQAYFSGVSKFYTGPIMGSAYVAQTGHWSKSSYLDGRSNPTYHFQDDINIIGSYVPTPHASPRIPTTSGTCVALGNTTHKVTFTDCPLGSCKAYTINIHAEIKRINYTEMSVSLYHNPDSGLYRFESVGLACITTDTDAYRVSSLSPDLINREAAILGCLYSPDNIPATVTVMRITLVIVSFLAFIMMDASLID